MTSVTAPYEEEEARERGFCFLSLGGNGEKEIKAEKSSSLDVAG